MSRPLVLFDGHCRFCNGWVRFVLRHETGPECLFMPLQSPAARDLLAPHGVDPRALESVYVLEDGRLYGQSDAALRLATRLRRPWRWLRLIAILPRAWRDAAYRLIGRWRYRLFGRSDFCSAAGGVAAERFPDQGIR